MDLFFPNTGPCDFFQPPKPLRDRVVSQQWRRHMHRVTERAGVTNSGNFGIGAASVDFDGDGFVDLLVTN